MRFKLTIGQKLAFGFGILLLAFGISGVVTLNILKKTDRLNERRANVITPSISMLKDLTLLVVRSKSLTVSWLDLDGEIAELRQKKELQALHNNTYPSLKKKLTNVLKSWPEEEKESMNSIFHDVDSLLALEYEVMDTYRVPDDYYKNGRPYLRDSLIKEYTQEEGPYFQLIEVIKSKIEKINHTLEGKATLSSQEMSFLFQRLGELIIYLGAFLSLGGGFVAFFTISAIVKPVKSLKGSLLLMGKGILPQKKVPQSGDEIGQMRLALNNLLDGLKRTSAFAEQIGEGNLDYEYQSLSEEDTLGNSLIIMRDNLAKVAEEDRKRNWATEGIANFGEVLRKHSESVELLSQNLIANLVSYLNANQGSVFVIDESNQHLELTGCYAWDRLKAMDLKIEKGEGLIGQCWQENDIIYMNDIPEDFINISSGLGDALPRCILIVPLVHNDHFYGAIELASFEEVEDYQITFVKRVAESAASTIASVKVNQQTKKLLSKSQQASETLLKREEELQKSQDELTASQSEMQKKLEDTESKLRQMQKHNEKLMDENKVFQNIILHKTKELDKYKLEKEE